MNNKTGIIIAGGRVSENEDINGLISKDTLVVCADAGYIYAEKMGIVPSAVIGDFDSMSKPAANGNFNILAYKSEKDETDTQLCIDYLISRGVNKIYIFGALGGKRIDHSFANFQLLEYAKKRGAEAVIKDGETNIFFVENEMVEVVGAKGDILSVFATDIAEDISYKGLKYQMEKGRLTSGIPYCISNEMTGDKATVSVQKGKLYIIHIRGDLL